MNNIYDAFSRLTRHYWSAKVSFVNHIVDPVKELQAFVSRYPTQQAAAKALGISDAYLHDMLHGNRNVSTTTLEKLGLTRVVVKQ